MVPGPDREDDPEVKPTFDDVDNTKLGQSLSESHYYLLGQLLPVSLLFKYHQEGNHTPSTKPTYNQSQGALSQRAVGHAEERVACTPGKVIHKSEKYTSCTNCFEVSGNTFPINLVLVVYCGNHSLILFMFSLITVLQIKTMTYAMYWRKLLM